MNIVTLYEPASSDGYATTGDGTYTFDKTLAEAISKQKHRGYAAPPIEHQAVAVGGGEFLLLKSASPVCLFNSKEAEAKIKQAALAKLSPTERQVLGV